MNLNQVTIYSKKTVETAEFFTKLGLVLIVDSLPRYARLECPDGESTLSIQHDGSAVVSNNIVLYFECADLDGEVERLKSIGVMFDEDPADRDWLWRQAYLKDPNGNKICLFHAGENRKNPPWRVK
ncbi:MAG: VOC family protein [Pyrinomonadaceae bacterium]